jgi:hypothetical protein
MYTRRNISVVVLTVALLMTLLVYVSWYNPRQQRLTYETEGHQFFREAQFDSAIARYEAAEEYGTLSENAESMLKVARILVDDSDLALDFFELVDSIGPKVFDSLGRPR